MGYAVYRDPSNFWRWAGYGVPAECDWPGCQQRIDRGLAHKCETHTWADDGDDDVIADEDGCALFFCEAHRYRTDEHDRIDPKPDSVEWMRHMRTDASWAEWRSQNPDGAERIRSAVEAA